MEYRKTVVLKDGRECLLRNAGEEDAKAVYDLFMDVHAQTDYLLTYPEEHSFTVESEALFLKKKTESENEIEIAAEVGGRIVATAGIDRLSPKEKTKHRAEFGISVDKAYWGLGIGKAMTEACIECAKAAGYLQLELDAVAENERAIALYKSAGFVEFGRNPRGFRSRLTGWQELVLMRLELDK
jgi:RimJ/RimL family protein N-acetyltransferase